MHFLNLVCNLPINTNKKKQKKKKETNDNNNNKPHSVDSRALEY